MDNKQETLIDWKTSAWKAPEMVSWYAGRMVENSGTNQLKNAVEVGLFEQYVTGVEVLDVGIGTGRASIPLLKKGLRVTGVDSSQAMLDECRRQAGGLPIALQLGDVGALPFSQSRFDSLISLNVMTHFPHWRRVLAEWKRVVKPGGRIVFDIYSMDHLSFVQGGAVSMEDILALKPDVFNMHLATTELFDYADEAGMRVVGVVPYGGLFSSRYRRFNAAAPLDTLHWWQRQLAWLSVDRSLFAAALFLETDFFPALTARTTGRFMVVLENEPDIAANAALRERQAEIDRLLDGRVDLDSLGPHLAKPAEAWQRELMGHMGPLRNRVLVYLVLTSFLRRPDAIDFVSFFGDEVGKEMQGWLEKESFDFAAHRIIEHWNSSAELNAAVSFEGNPVRGCAEYELTKAIMMNAKKPQVGMRHD